MKTTLSPKHQLQVRAKILGLHGVLKHWEAMVNEPWLPTLIEQEEKARDEISLSRRSKAAKLGSFKPMTEFLWSWPKTADADRIQECFSLSWIANFQNIIIVGPNGIGKTMIAKNIAEHAVAKGYSSLFVTTSSLLMDLAEQETPSALKRRLRFYCRPDVLVLDELGYLASSAEHGDLLFELVSMRYEKKPMIITSNKPFDQWKDLFPSTTCVTALVDRLVHHAEIISLEGQSFRLKEATERETSLLAQRTSRRTKKV